MTGCGIRWISCMNSPQTSSRRLHLIPIAVDHVLEIVTRREDRAFRREYGAACTACGDGFECRQQLTEMLFRQRIPSMRATHGHRYNAVASFDGQVPILRCHVDGCLLEVHVGYSPTRSGRAGRRGMNRGFYRDYGSPDARYSVVSASTVPARLRPAPAARRQRGRSALPPPRQGSRTVEQFASAARER